METLYKIETDYTELITKIELAEGEITPEIEELLTINEKQLQSKSIAYLSVIKNKEAFITQIDEEIKRLQALKRKNDNIVCYLKGRLLNAVKVFGNFEVGLTKFGTRKSEAVIVDDVNSLPKEFKTIKVTEQPNKRAIKEAIKNGQDIKGCKIQENLNLKIN